MKKLKLSKSKNSDAKQPKISNFFNLKTEASVSVKQEKCEDKQNCNEAFDNKCLPVRQVCVNCLQISPKRESKFCNNCNLSHKMSPKTCIEETNALVQSNEDCAMKLVREHALSVCDSPDVIPPTPPVITKDISNRKSGVSKCVKRKFNFFETDCEKKKMLCSEQRQSRTKGISINNVEENNENLPRGKRKNFRPSLSKNPFCKSSNKSTSAKSSQFSFQASEMLQDCNLAHSETTVQSGLLVSNLFKKSSTVSSKKENARSEEKSTVEKVDLTIGDCSINCPERSTIPRKETSSNVCNHGHEEDLEAKTLQDHKTIPNLRNDPVAPFDDELLTETLKDHSLQNNLLSKKDDKFLVEQPYPRHKSLQGINIPFCSSDIKLVHSQESFPQGKTYDKLGFPPTVKHAEQVQTRTIVNDDEDSSTSFLDDLSFEESTFKVPVKLEDGVRCLVLSVERLESCGEVVLNVKPCDSTSDKESAICVLRGSWTNTVVSVGDMVSVWAQPEGQAGCWAVSNESGLLVTHPDMLVSGTTVVGSLFCLRRAVLSDMYRGMDSDSSVMAVGCFLHELLQEVLKKRLSLPEEIKKVVDDYTSSRQFIYTLYASKMPLDKTRETLNEFIPKMHMFVKKYISSNKSYASGKKDWNDKDSWNGTITDVADIEENIWSPKLGIKGKVDVTVKTSARNKKAVMPLELKTGKASFSAEHRGQVILYTMMMSELGQSVDSGLLLYLREGVMQEVQVGTAERRDLVLLRNQLVTRLRASQQVMMSAEDCLQIAAPALPPPINHHSACSKCPYLTICSSALRLRGYEELSESNPLHGLSVASIEHLLPEHSAYVFHWTGLLRLEHTENQLRSPAVHDIWTLPAADRRKRGSCIPNTRLVGSVAEVTPGSYEHVFEWDDGADVTCSFVEGDYLIVSSETRPAVAAGPVRTVSFKQLTLHLERDLSVQVKEKSVWHLDKYQSQSGLVFNMTNLGCLLDNTEQADRLRKVVISREVPLFRPKLSSRVLKASVDLLAPLNDQQRRAVFQTLAADQYLLIKGMPGTGKTATIVALVQLAVRLGQSVLITSHTHSAVDNVLLRLRDKVDMLRLGAVHKLHPQLTPYADTVQNCTTPEEINVFYNSKSVVAVTCLGCSHPLLSRRQFDLCLVDEATQVLQPTVLRPLFSARKFVLIGDPNQLPPLVRSAHAKELGLGQSLFARLDRPAVTVELSLQYRMNQQITTLANSLTYSGKLQCASAATASATLCVNPQALVGQPDWMSHTLSSSLDLSVIVLDTGPTEATNCINHREADIVMQILTVLNKQGGVSEDRTGVIAPYRAQVDLLRRRTLATSSTVEVNTVDQYQGRDKDVIIYSCTRSVKPTESDILGDKNRLTVAVTRARHKLVILGDVNLLRGYPLFGTLFASLPATCFVQVPPSPS